MPDSSEEEQRTVRRDAKIGWTILMVLLLAVLISVAWPWLYAQEGAGFGVSKVPKDERYKTLWDWLQLLIVPLVLAGIALWFNWRTHKTEIELAEKRKAYEEEIATDRLHEATLQAYLDQMTELLLRENLRSSSEDSEVRDIARVRTVTALRRLDGKRNEILLSFLRESKLIRPNQEVISLRDSDFTGADFHEANLGLLNLENADLSDADFSQAFLYKTNLHSANLTGANFNRAYLDSVDMSDANLRKACLRGADLSGSVLKGAILVSADLCEANLGKVNLSDALVLNSELAKANSLRAAIMRDGSRYNGRFNLIGDVKTAHAEGVNITDPLAMERWYASDEGPSSNMSENGSID